jgi:hypothetical protein
LSTCIDTTTRSIAGTFDGAAVGYTVRSGSFFSRRSPAYFDLRTWIGSNGVLHAWGPQMVFSVGDSGAGKGHLFTATEGAFGNTHFCAADVSVTYVSTFRHTTTFSGWTRLGSCPANPGTGTLSGCFDQATSGPVLCASGQAHLVGTVDGTSMDASYVTNTTTATGSIDAETLMSFGTGGLIALRTTSGSGSGFIMLPEDGPNPGSIVCVGSATLTRTPTDRYTFTLDALGVVGTCPGPTQVTGQLDGCL